MASTRVRFTDEERKIRKNESNRRWRLNHLEYARQYDKEREKLRPRRKHKIDFKKRWRIANPELAHKERRKTTLHKYGLTPTEYNTMVALQDNKCAICKTNNPGRNRKYWCIDHCHETNTVRRLLCHMCNVGIGCFKHNIVFLQAAIDYLTQVRRQ